MARLILAPSTIRCCWLYDAPFSTSCCLFPTPGSKEIALFTERSRPQKSPSYSLCSSHRGGSGRALRSGQHWGRKETGTVVTLLRALALQTRKKQRRTYNVRLLCSEKRHLRHIARVTLTSDGFNRIPRPSFELQFHDSLPLLLSDRLRRRKVRMTTLTLAFSLQRRSKGWPCTSIRRRSKRQTSWRRS